MDHFHSVRPRRLGSSPRGRLGNSRQTLRATPWLHEIPEPARARCNPTLALGSASLPRLHAQRCQGNAGGRASVRLPLVATCGITPHPLPLVPQCGWESRGVCWVRQGRAFFSDYDQVPANLQSCWSLPLFQVLRLVNIRTQALIF